MEETDVEVILQRACEKYPEAKPRIISDSGPQFISRDLMEFIRIAGMMAHYKLRIHSAIGYVMPHSKLAGNEKEVFTAHDEKLETARESRRVRLQHLAAQCLQRRSLRDAIRSLTLG